MNNGKVRIYELSKELELQNKEILKICSELSMEVKSHSSTITEPQAENIRAAARTYKSSQKSQNTEYNKTENRKDHSYSSMSQSSEVNKENLKQNPKQEILAIHKHPRPSHLEGQTEQARTSDQRPKTPSLLAPPRPFEKTSDVKSEGKKLTQESPIPLKKPVLSSNSDSREESELQSRLQANGEGSEDKKNVYKPKKPKLVSFSDRSDPDSSDKTVNFQDKSSVTINKPKPKLSSDHTDNIGKAKNQYRDKNRTSDNQETFGNAKNERNQRPQLSDRSISQEGSSELNRDFGKNKPKPRLQEPPQRPLLVETALDLDLQDETAVPVVIEDDDLETETLLLDKPKRTKQKQKRPEGKGLPIKGLPSKSIPKLVGNSWDDEEEVLVDEKKINKAPTKGKRRAVIIEDDDEDLDDLTKPNSTGGETISLALARPDSKKSSTSQSIEREKQPHKPKPKLEKNDPKAETKENLEQQKLPETIVLSQSLTLRQLADLLNIPETDIIRQLFFKGIAVNITETLDFDTAKMVAEELGVKVETETQKASAEKTEMLAEADLENLHKRPPVVTIMGHVDHGKTTLLDSIRKTKVAQGEAGGITQHIGAYHVDVEHEGVTQQVVFLDTPGHEAFTAMRARGTKVTDIAVLVVAADDGVQPQTREAISHAKAAQVPIVVAINKMDKPDSNPDRVKNELVELGLVPDDWGGDTVMVPVSALKGENLDALLDMIVTVSEIAELSANPDRHAKGTVIEAHLDRTRGPVASLLVQNGTLRVGDIIVAGSVSGKIRAMIDDRGDKVEAATPSFAVEVLGLNEVPAAGDEFDVYDNEKEAKALAESRAEAKRDNRLQQAMSSRRVSLSTLSAKAQQGELKELNLIIKADVQGSAEAILNSLKQLPQKEVQIRVLLSSAGEITETDIDLAAASGAVIIGFNTSLASGAKQAAEQETVDIREYNVIYQLLDEIQGAMEGLLDPEQVEQSLGNAEVRAVFSVGRGAVAGCYVLSGKLVRNRLIRVRRNGQVLYDGNLDSLRRVKDDVKDISAGYECGIATSKFNDWQEGDSIEAYEMIFKRRTLSQ